MRDNGPTDFNTAESNNNVESKFSTFLGNDFAQIKDVSNKELDQKENGNLLNVPVNHKYLISMYY